MNLTECIRVTRNAHELLRSRTLGTRPDEQSSTAYQIVKKGLDKLWAAAQQRADNQQICNVIGGLTIDAECFAGLNDSEGFRDASDVWQQYGYLEETIGSK
jgi:uncharacterized protein (DUF3084 family)